HDLYTYLISFDQAFAGVFGLPDIAFLWHDADLDGVKPFLSHELLDFTTVVIPKRHLVESRRIPVKEARNCLVSDLGQFVVLHRIPNVEEKTAAWFKDAVCLADGRAFIRNKHETELTDDCVICRVGKW